MNTLRALDWDRDRAGVLGLDTSFTTKVIYRLTQTDHCATLEVTPAHPPIRKVYALGEDLLALAQSDWAQVAVSRDRIVGLAVMGVRQWNRRAELAHLYVTASARGQGVGRALVDAALREAQRQAARCLWVETQTINYPAIQFYQRLGFGWCGFDTSLYDAGGAGAGEIAVFFARPMP